MASITVRSVRDGSKRYTCRVRSGGEIVTKTFGKLKDAKSWAREIEGRIETGEFTAPSNKTLSDAVDRYLTHILPEKAASTQPGQRRQLNWWREQLGNVALERLTPALIGEYRDKLIAERGASGPTANRYLAALSHALSMSVEWGWIQTNPTSKVSRRKENIGRVRFLDRKELPRFLAECKASRQRELYPIVLLALSTGLRRGELLGLRWRHVDFKRGFLYVLETKNSDRKGVPVTGKALQEFKRYYRERKRRDPEREISADDLVFPGRDPDCPADFRNAFDHACKRAKIEDFKFHDLRHCCASYLAMSGATLAEISEVLGHRTLAMVKRYSHLSKDHVTSVVERMNKEWLS